MSWADAPREAAGVAPGVTGVRRHRPRRRPGEHYTVCLYSSHGACMTESRGKWPKKNSDVWLVRRFALEVSHGRVNDAADAAQKEKPAEHRVRMAVPHSLRAKADRPLTSRHLAPLRRSNADRRWSSYGSPPGGPHARRTTSRSTCMHIVRTL